MNINLWDSIIWCLIIIRAEQTCWWPNHTSHASLSVCPVLIGQFLESWSLIGGMTIIGQTSTSLSGESSGLTLMVAVSPVLDWPCLFLIRGCLLITFTLVWGLNLNKICCKICRSAFSIKSLIALFGFSLLFEILYLLFERSPFECWILRIWKTLRNVQLL